MSRSITILTPSCKSCHAGPGSPSLMREGSTTAQAQCWEGSHREQTGFELSLRNLLANCIKFYSKTFFKNMKLQKEMLLCTFKTAASATKRKKKTITAFCVVLFALSVLYFFYLNLYN